MKTLAILRSSTMLIAAAFANTNAGSKVYFAEDPVGETDLTKTQYEALDWTQVKGVGSVGETGTSENILSYDTWDTTVSLKAKGITDAGSPAVELARIATDPGQIALRAAARTNLNYAFKIERNDKQTLAGTPTIIYNRGLVTGPSRPNGRNEDFDIERFTFALQQVELVVAPT